ncbi:MAG: hypothetical protein GY765_26920, partial [bacterium]|nr:hypothetical protein [bacterium]
NFLAFFNLGGDSIKTIQIQARMNKAGFKLEVNEIFKNPTIRVLAQKARKLERTLNEPAAPGQGTRSHDVKTKESAPGDFYGKHLYIPGSAVFEQSEIEDIYPLSPMQEGMLLHSLQDAASSFYLQQIVYRLRGRLEPRLVEDTLCLLSKRYDILRTAFVYQDYDRPLQIVLKERNIEFVYEDISEKSEEIRIKYIKDYIKRDRQKRFSLSNDILMRFALIRTAEEQYRVIWTYH